VAHVPWARPGAKCTYLLEDTCAWLAKNMALTAVTVDRPLQLQDCDLATSCSPMSVRLLIGYPRHRRRPSRV